MAEASAGSSGRGILRALAAFRALAENPRPLADAEREVLRRAVAPLMADLAASGMRLPDIREDAHEERESPSICGWIQGPGGTGEGISVLLETSPAEQVAQLAEQFQNWAADQLHDARRSPEWPAYPSTPERRTGCSLRSAMTALYGHAGKPAR